MLIMARMVSFFIVLCILYLIIYHHNKLLYIFMGITTVMIKQVMAWNISRSFISFLHSKDIMLLLLASS